jgi:hypothetical protein
MAKKTGPKGPYKKTEEVVSKLETALAAGCNKKEACDYVLISRDTFYDWMEKDKEFSDRMRRAILSPILKARVTIVKNLDNPKYADRYLERLERRKLARDGGVSEDEKYEQDIAAKKAEAEKQASLWGPLSKKTLRYMIESNRKETAKWEKEYAEQFHEDPPVNTVPAFIPLYGPSVLSLNVYEQVVMQEEVELKSWPIHIVPEGIRREWAERMRRRYN